MFALSGVPVCPIGCHHYHHQTSEAAFLAPFALSTHPPAGVMPSPASDCVPMAGIAGYNGDSPPMAAATTSSSNAIGSQAHGPELGLKLGRVKSIEVCRVCGDGPARMHYGVPTCFGCKGFFRRTLKRTKEYTCRYNGSCVVDRYERNSCRFCRFKRCLEVGMDPKAVRPDRDAAGRSHPIRHRRSRASLGELTMEEEENPTDDWVRKLPVDMRTLLMQIMNIEVLVSHGDTAEDAKKLYPLPYNSLRQIFEDISLLDGKRTEIRYETFRQVQANELAAVAHRRLIACIDTVDHLFTLMDLHNIDDKIAVVKGVYAPLSIFSFAASTTKVTKQRDVLCLCNYGFLPRNFQSTTGETFHLGNRVVEKTIDDLVEPFRAFNFKDQELALMGAIVVLNPHIKVLSGEAAEQIADLRDRVQETLYNVVRESHPKEVASSRFGNLLLFLPTIMMLGNIIYENLQFAQSFGGQQVDPLLSELLDSIEPIHDVNGMNVDEVLSMADHTDQFIRSQSSSSISSMNSHGSGSSFEQGYSSAASCGQAMKQEPGFQDSDPEYNMTLTQGNYANIAHSLPSQPMDIDSCCGNSMLSGSDGAASPHDYFQAKPKFFIEPNGTPMNGVTSAGQPTVVSGGQHVFTVEANRDPMYAATASKSAHCLLNRFQGGIPQASSASGSQHQLDQCGYPNGNPEHAGGYAYPNMQNGNANYDMNGHGGQNPLLYEDPNQSQQHSLSKSQSYPCYGYLLDDNESGPPTLQAQQNIFQQNGRH
uniref:Nuclear receptor domain-containing protein n=1 Tax=Panagrellus redivivus TaxID=6233 RepID=A0A7E4W5G2_PANRE